MLAEGKYHLTKNHLTRDVVIANQIIIRQGGKKYLNICLELVEKNPTRYKTLHTRARVLLDTCPTHSFRDEAKLRAAEDEHDELERTEEEKRELENAQQVISI